MSRPQRKKLKFDEDSVNKLLQEIYEESFNIKAKIARLYTKWEIKVKENSEVAAIGDQIVKLIAAWRRRSPPRPAPTSGARSCARWRPRRRAWGCRPSCRTASDATRGPRPSRASCLTRTRRRLPRSWRAPGAECWRPPPGASAATTGRRGGTARR